MIQEIEEKAIEDFRTEFAELCKKHWIGAIVVGARSQTEKFEDIPDESMCAAFCSSHIEDPSLNQLKAIDTAFDKAEEEIISKMQRDIGFRLFEQAFPNSAELRKTISEFADKLREKFWKECECEDCKKEAAEKATEDKVEK